MRRTVASSVMVASTRILRAHLGQARTSKPHVRFIKTAHSMYLDAAKSSPSMRRPQCATEIVVGEALTTGSSTCASDGGGANGGAAIAGAGDAGAGDAGAGDAGAGDAGAGDAGAGADGTSAQGFGFAAWAGGFVVTSARHDERGAKTP